MSLAVGGMVIGGIVVVAVIIGVSTTCCHRSGGGGQSSQGGSEPKTPSFSCSGPSIVIKTKQDALNVAQCNTFVGNVDVDPTFIGSLELGTKISQINGDLRCTGVHRLDSISLGSLSSVAGSIYLNDLPSTMNLILTNLTKVRDDLRIQDIPILESISGSSLRSVGSNFGLVNLASLSSIDFATLNYVNGTLSIQSTPSLEALNFDTVLRSAKAIDISNTSLTNLTLTKLEQVSDMNIVKNRALDHVNVEVLKFMNNFNMEDGGRDLSINFQALQDAGSIQLKGVSSVMLSSLSNISGNISVRDSAQLQALSLPKLSQIHGGLSIVNNSKLQNLDGFPLLSNVGNMIMEGNFISLSFPSLRDVAQDMSVKTSTTNTSICTYVNSLQGRNRVVHGKVTCYPQSGLAKSNIAGIVAGAVLGIVFVIVSFGHQAYLLWRPKEDTARPERDAESVSKRHSS